MNSNLENVRDYYDTNVEDEWGRIAERPEFLLTCRMLDRYMRPGDTVLDIGGGPGRYSLYLAAKGCRVTLFDLSSVNAEFALKRAAEQKLTLNAVVGDAREADSLLSEQFDHVLLMGPMYHLLEEADRNRSVEAALNLLKPGGLIYIVFLNLVSGITYALQHAPHYIASDLPSEIDFQTCFAEKRSFAGDAWTKAYFMEQSEILSVAASLPLEKLHLFGQEGILAPFEKTLMAQPKEIIDLWLDYCEKVWEREELFCLAEHLMYVGRKPAE